MDTQEHILKKEKEFHDAWSSNINIHDIDVAAYFEGSTSPENRFILHSLGDIKGKRVLDLGCGAGESSVYFALKGARCVATDLSPGMVEKQRALAARYGVAIESEVMNSMEITFPDRSFDIVYAANLLHHVNPEKALHEMHRVLRCGGKACFWDPLRHNPIINIYRRLARDVRTSDEMPLDMGFLRLVRQIFSEVAYDTFWLISLWIFIKFYLIEGVDPSKERYWKKIIYEEPRLRDLYYRLERFDRVFKKLPFTRRFAWNIAVVATK